MKHPLADNPNLFKDLKKITQDPQMTDAQLRWMSRTLGALASYAELRATQTQTPTAVSACLLRNARESFEATRRS